MRLCAVLLLLCLLPSTAEARGKWKRAYKWSVGALIAANAADFTTTVACRDCMEGNPLARNSAGGFAVRRGVLIKTAAVGGVLLLQRRVLKGGKKPCYGTDADREGTYRFLATLNLISAGGTAAISARNIAVMRGSGKQQ